MSDAPPKVTLLPASERDLICERAGTELLDIAAAWRTRHALTGAEFKYLVAVLLFRQLRDDCNAEREK